MDFQSDWIIAEIGSVHDGSFGNATKLIEAAAYAGANCVKFQTHIADAETLDNAPAPSYFNGENRINYFRRTAFSPGQWELLAQSARTAGVAFLASPFAMEAVDLLEAVGVSAYKVASGEVTNLPMLERISETKKPVILSSGMSTWSELNMAVKTLKYNDLCIMQCTSAYPTLPSQVGLNNLAEIATRFPRVALGFSDHTMGVAAGIAAVTLGARVIEKHFTFSRLMYGSDALHSMEPDEFCVFAKELKIAWEIRRNPVDKDQLAINQLNQMKMIFQKSIVTACDIKAGTELTLEHLAFKKPGDGISAAEFKKVVGRKIKNTVPQNHKLIEDDFE
jgi:N-acetylneuraminate synthase